MGTCNALAEHRRAGRFNSHDLHVRVLFLEVFAHTGNRTARTYAGHEDVHLAIGIFPDFGTRGRLVGSRVGRVHELARDEAIRDFLREFVGLGDSALHALRTFSEHEFSTVGLHQLAAFHTHGLGHHDDDAVTAGSGHRGKANASVTGSRFDNDSALLELAALFGVIEHRLRDTVLHGTGGVEVFELREDRGTETFFDVGEFEKRGVTNELVGRGVDFRHFEIPFLNCHSGLVPESPFIVC